MNWLQRLWRDILLVITNLKYVPYLTKRNPTDDSVYKIISKGCPKHQPKSIWYTLYHAIVPHIHLHDHTPFIATVDSINEHKSDNTTIVYINGITTSRNKFESHVILCSHIFNHKVTGLYNPTNGMIVDLLECLLGRTLNIREPVTKSFEKIIRQQLITQEKVILIGHSQGAIIITNIIKLLKQDKETVHHLHKLRVITFGSAADEMPIIPYSPIHIANDKDFIARIGILGCEKSSYGKVIVVDRLGHSFERIYLPGLVDGKYGTDNELFQYIKPLGKQK